MKPRYEHDCSACVFLGQYQEYDLYFCPGEPTIVCREDANGYRSGMVFAVASKNRCYQEALILALRTEHKDKIVKYFREYHSEFPERRVKFSELRLIAETDPKDYPELIKHLKYFTPYVEEYLNKGEN